MGAGACKFCRKKFFRQCKFQNYRHHLNSSCGNTTKLSQTFGSRKICKHFGFKMFSASSDKLSASLPSETTCWIFSLDSCVGCTQLEAGNFRRARRGAFLPRDVHFRCFIRFASLIRSLIRFHNDIRQIQIDSLLMEYLLMWWKRNVTLKKDSCNLQTERGSVSSHRIFSLNLNGQEGKICLEKKWDQFTWNSCVTCQTAICSCCFLHFWPDYGQNSLEKRHSGDFLSKTAWIVDLPGQKLPILSNTVHQDDSKRATALCVCHLRRKSF